MYFDLSDLTGNEVTFDMELPIWISENYKWENYEPSIGNRIRIPVQEWNDKINSYQIIKGFEWLEAKLNNHKEIFVTWDSDDKGNVVSWWITGDSI